MVPPASGYDPFLFYGFNMSLLQTNVTYRRSHANADLPLKKERQMSEEVTTEVSKEQPADEVGLDDLLKTAPVVVTQKPEAKKAEPETVAEPAEPAEEEQTETPEETPSSEEAPEKGEAPAKPAKETEVPPEYQEYKKVAEQREKWQKSLTQKSQLVSSYSDDQLQEIQAEVKLRKELEKIQPTPLPEYLEEEYTDELGDKQITKVPSAKIQKIVDQKVEEARNAWIKEKALDFSKGEQAVQEAERLSRESAATTAIVGITAYYNDFPDSAIDLGDDPVQTLSDIKQAGKLHPDYKKLLRLETVANWSKEKGVTMKQAHNDIFGLSEQQKKANEKIRKEQLKAQPEKPGQSSKAVTEDEKFNRSLGIGVKQMDSVFD